MRIQEWWRCLRGKHVPVTQFEHRRRKKGLGYDYRATGREECYYCHRDTGPIPDDFRRENQHLFEWH